MTDPFEPEAGSLFTIYFRDGRERTLTAETIRRPEGGRHFWTLEIQGEPVAEFHREAVSGWSVKRS